MTVILITSHWLWRGWVTVPSWEYSFVDSCSFLVRQKSLLSMILCLILQQPLYNIDKYRAFSRGPHCLACVAPHLVTWTTTISCLLIINKTQNQRTVCNTDKKENYWSLAKNKLDKSNGIRAGERMGLVISMLTQGWTRHYTYSTQSNETENVTKERLVTQINSGMAKIILFNTLISKILYIINYCTFIQWQLLPVRPYPNTFSHISGTIYVTS